MELPFTLRLYQYLHSHATTCMAFLAKAHCKVLKRRANARGAKVRWSCQAAKVERPLSAIAYVAIGSIPLVPASHASVQPMTVVRGILPVKNCFSDARPFDVVRPGGTIGESAPTTALRAYSTRRASFGSTRVAQNAGTRHANKVVMTNNTTAASADTSSVETPKS